MKHTPGPWIYKVIPENSIISIQSEFPSNEQIRREDSTLCGIWGFDSGRSKDHQIANAKLIAASPDLLTVLEDLTFGILSGMGKSAIQLRVQLALDALDKAKL